MKLLDQTSYKLVAESILLLILHVIAQKSEESGAGGESGRDGQFVQSMNSIRTPTLCFRHSCQRSNLT
jgi:hypothetical protein